MDGREREREAERRLNDTKLDQVEIKQLREETTISDKQLNVTVSSTENQMHNGSLETFHLVNLTPPPPPGFISLDQHG